MEYGYSDYFNMLSYAQHCCIKLGVKHAIPITEEHEVVPSSDFKLTPESKNFNISMSTAFYYVTQDTLKKVKTSETSFIISLYHPADSLLCTKAKSWS